MSIILERAVPAYDFVTVDVFTDQRFGGNPLAVFPRAEGLDTETMQSIALEFNLSETTFVLPPLDVRHDAQVRIFTPRTELPFAGHPNVGTAFVLGRAGHRGRETLAFEERAGIVAAHLKRGSDGGVVGARIAAPQPLSVGVVVSRGAIARCVGVDETAIVATTHEPVVASVGTPFVFVELATLGALERAAPQVEAFRQAADTTPGMDLHFAVHLYVRQARPDTVRARMFAPLAGVVEDPATGSAAAALAALLTSRGPHTEQAFVIEQGQETGRPSQMEAAARRDADGTVRAWVGGRCVPVMSGRLEL